MPEIRALCDALFPAGHDVRADGELVHGTGRTLDGPVAVIGTRDHAAIGVDLAYALADEVLKVVREQPDRPILMLVDTQGQRLSRRDELLGNGGFLALGMIADRTYALADAQIRVMALPAMARITQIPIEELESLCRTSPIFGPGVQHYERLGAVEAVWSDGLAGALHDALRVPAGGDRRAALGRERGGRTLAHEVVQAVLDAD